MRKEAFVLNRGTIQAIDDFAADTLIGHLSNKSS